MYVALALHFMEVVLVINTYLTETTAEKCATPFFFLLQTILQIAPLKQKKKRSKKQSH